MPTLIRVEETIEIPERLPVVALRDLVFFPYMVLPLLIGRPRSVAALQEAQDGDGHLLLVAQLEAMVEDPEADDLHRIGTVARVLEVSRLPDGTSRVVLEGLGRAHLREISSEEAGFRGSVELLVERESGGGDAGDAELVARIRQVRKAFEEYVRLHERIPGDLQLTVGGVSDPVRLAHLMAGHLLLPADEKQALLEEKGLAEQYATLQRLIARELEILRIEEKLDEQIRLQIDSDRKQHYLQEQLKAIHRELGEEKDGEWTDLERSLEDAELPPPARERAERELSRLRQLNPVAPEASVIRTYLDWIVGLPWSRTTEDTLDVEAAQDLLDRAHYGLEEVKERILDHIAVLSLVREMKGPILCLVGPPGVGKTSLGRSIAEALGREFVRVSLGGVRDEAEIRGHRRTYVGALPGRILQGMRRSGSRNPVFLLDEVDKLASDFHGDPGAALLEVLDPEQNRSFTDHYLELEFDLSDVLFVATANTLGGIPAPLRDRMEVIRLPGYLETEKRTIARRFLWPRQAEQHGLSTDTVGLTADALERVIHRYTREAGVRELERRIGRLARKVARRTVSGEREGGAKTEIGVDDLRELLGPPPYTPPELEEEGERVGIANGLAWTAAGGEVLDVEVAVVPGEGKIQLTGTLGDVMKESAIAALTYARSRAGRLGLDTSFHETVDIHIHIPEGATPKDGPSAGITIATALISALTDTPTRADVAMTGEITLRGRVLGVGGIKEKSVAALRTGVRRVLIPDANRTDLELLPEEVRDGLEFVPVGTMDEVLEAALGQRTEKSADGAATASGAPEGRDGGDGSSGDDRERAARPDVLDGVQDPGIQLSQ